MLVLLSDTIRAWLFYFIVCMLKNQSQISDHQFDNFIYNDVAPRLKLVRVLSLFICKYANIGLLCMRLQRETPLQKRGKVLPEMETKWKWMVWNQIV